MKMNMPNAVGFFAVGLLMEGLHFLPTITGIREMWLLVMGAVLITIGVAAFAQEAWMRMAPRVASINASLSSRRAEAHLAHARGQAANTRRVSI